MQTVSMFFIALVFKITSLLVGFACVYLGYRLFEQGRRSGGADTIRITRWLVVEGGGPGIFFAVVGGTIMLMSVHRGLDMKTGGTPPPDGEEAAATTPHPATPEEHRMGLVGDEASASQAVAAPAPAQTSARPRDTPPAPDADSPDEAAAIPAACPPCP